MFACTTRFAAPASGGLLQLLLLLAITTTHHLSNAANLIDPFGGGGGDTSLFTGTGGGIQLPNVTLPDLSAITDLISRHQFVFDQDPAVRHAVRALVDILQQFEEPTALVQAIRQLSENPDLNPNLVFRAVVITLINRSDRANWRIPSLVEAAPDLALPNSAVDQIRLQWLLPVDQRQCVVVDGTSGLDNGIDNLLWYFREDVAINSNHWFWHLYYPISGTAPRDRRGELLFIFHHQLMARYAAEKLSNSLPDNSPFIVYKGSIVPEPYNSHLTDTNSKQNWQDRPVLQRIPDVISTSFVNSTIEQAVTYRDRIISSIDNGNLVLPDGSLYPIRNFGGVDALGNVLEAQSSYSLNTAYYNSFGYHNLGHIFIGNIMYPIDPAHAHPPGVMSDTATAMRDVIFYRWHLYIDQIFLRHKNTLAPYQPTGGDFPLKWAGISVDTISVRSKTPVPVLNSLRTFWSTETYTLTNGLDFERNSTQGGVQVCVKHLNHEEFEYKIQITNNNGPTVATVRIFLAPKRDNFGVPYSMEQQYKLFFALDTFRVNLASGINQITRQSIDSTLTITLNQALNELNNDQARSTVYCGCGYPHYLLLPKGKQVGMDFDLFVMASQELDSTVPMQPPPATTPTGNTCDEAYIFCGSFQQKYPDTKPMGYPFDRRPYSVTDYLISFPLPLLPYVRTVRDLAEYMKPIGNMRSTIIQIVHVNNSTAIANL